MSDQDQNKLEALVNDALMKARSSEGARNILAHLFPRVEKVLQTYAPISESIEERKRRRRLSVADYSESYFSLTPQMNSWGQLEFDTAIKAGPDEAFSALHRKLEQSSEDHKSDLRRIFLELLDAEFSTRRSLDDDWLSVILKESPDLLDQGDEQRLSFFSFNNLDRLRALLFHGLKNVAASEAARLLKSAISSADDLSLLADLVRSLLGDTHPDGATHERMRVDLDHQAESIRELLLGRVRELSSTNDIWSQARPEQLLWFWWGSNNESEVKSFTSNSMDTLVGVKALLRITPGTVVSSEGNFERVGRTWNKIVDLDLLSRRAEALLINGSEADALLAKRFLEAVKRGRESSF